jgi:DNA-binding transcriptional LysR family regulator
MNRTHLPYTLEQLIILRAVANDGSFKNAAQSLFLTQPAVSLQIQNLEKQLKITLFDRTKKQVELTEAGNLLVRYSNNFSIM